MLNFRYLPTADTMLGFFEIFQQTVNLKTNNSVHDLLANFTYLQVEDIFAL